MDDLLAAVKTVLGARSDVRLALVFGSRARGDARPDSDLDVAALFDADPDLLELGGLVSELESATGLEVDLVELRNLPSREPYLAYLIAAEGVAAFERAPGAFADYKTQACIRWFDIQDFHERQMLLMRERIEAGSFGRPTDA